MSGIVGGAGSKSGVIGTTELFYEEGTWSPVVATGTVSNATGTYTKVGNLVNVVLYLNGFSNYSSGTNITVSPLPFTSNSVGTSHGTCLTSYFNSLEEQVSVVNSNSANMVFHHSDGNGDYFAIEHAHIPNNSTATRLFATITYRAAS